MIYIDDIKKLSRRRDPHTSKTAALFSRKFAPSHKDRIMAALTEHGACSARQLEAHTGLTVVQIDRRLHELRDDGKIAPTGMVVGKCIVYEVVK